MRAVILAGGVGSRLSEETGQIPKPMVEIGSRPILWHIMKIYASYGIDEFIICLGYKGHLIKRYFADYRFFGGSVTVDLTMGKVEYHDPHPEPWRVALVDTGAETGTGGRLKAIAGLLGSEPFCMTYGDGVGDVDIRKLVAFHKSHGKLATITAVLPPARFGALRIADDVVTKFEEKPAADDGWINGGFFVLDPAVLGYIGGTQTMWEQEPLRNLARDRQLAAFRHRGFWHPMDTLREKRELDRLWREGTAPWKTWP